MKIGIDLGHGLWCDGGAVGIGNEEKMINQVGKLVVRKLEAIGHEIVLCRPKSARNTLDSLWKRCKAANDTGVDLFVSLHFNASGVGGHGCECFYISGAGKSYAESVTNAIAKLGFRNRGAKRGKYYVLRNTKAPAILVEGCFVDSQRDMGLFNSEKMATAIVEGLTGETLGSCTCR